MAERTKWKRVIFTCPPELLEKLDRYCELYHFKRGEAIRKAIRRLVGIK